MYKICIPTYNKKELLSLELLKADPIIELNYFVRQEQLDEGFYDFLKEMPRVNIISLGDNVKDIGDTRERILQHCIDNDVDYCVMLDDGVYSLHEDTAVGHKRSVHELIELTIERMRQTRLSDFCVGAGFRKNEAQFANGKRLSINFGLKMHDYLGFTPTQAIVLDTKLCVKHDLHYHTLDKVGFEDCAFYVDALKKGLVFATPWTLCFAAIVPNSTKVGGNHKPNENIEHKYDMQAATCKAYIGDIYGIGMSKRYRSYANAFLTMIEVDNSYFWEVLVADRERNRKIIDANFKICR